MTYTIPKITDRAMRDRLERDHAAMERDLDELAKLGPGPRQSEDNHKAILRSGRSNAHDLKAKIAAWDRAHKGPAKRRNP